MASKKTLRDSAPDISFVFNKEDIKAKEGDTFASALTSAGIYDMKESLDGSRRGLYCGMGVCNECAIVINGTPGKLACMTYVCDGDVALRQPAFPIIESVGYIALPESEISPEVLVIGAGPAGLAAAAVCAEAGLRVVLLDEREKLGGQYFKQPADSLLREEQLDGQFLEGRAMIQRVKTAGVEVLTGTSIWGAFAPDHLVATSAQKRWVLKPKNLVIATGAYEKGFQIPGWTLPGVMTTGSAQTLLRSYQVPLGTQVFISGNGPLNIQMAAELVRAGGSVVGLAELSSPFKMKNILTSLTLAWYSPKLVLNGIGYFFTLLKARVPIYFSSAVVEASGAPTLNLVKVKSITSDGSVSNSNVKQFPVDALALGYGFMPSNEIARSLGCKHIFDNQSQTLQVSRDNFGETSIKGVYVIGDSGGISGAQVAKAIGIIAGHAISCDAGKVISSALTSEIKSAQRRFQRNMKFQRKLWKVFSASINLDQINEPETIICRCLSLTKRDISEQISDELLTAGALKRVTRAGMGICQGRYCSSFTIAKTAEKTLSTPSEFSGFAPQAPFKPTAIGIIAESTSLQ
jgi:thioredoxin reductase